MADRKQEQERVDAWNRDMPMGSLVTYAKDSGELLQTVTRSKAQVLSGHTAVIWLEDVTGCVALERVSPR